MPYEYQPLPRSVVIWDDQVQADRKRYAAMYREMRKESPALARLVYRRIRQSQQDCMAEMGRRVDTEAMCAGTRGGE